MRYALNLPNGGAWSDPRTLGELARLAEESGWDGVFLEDYIVWQSQQDVPTYDPWISLAAMAIQTKHIRLGTNVTPLARRRPWKVEVALTVQRSTPRASRCRQRSIDRCNYMRAIKH